MDFSEVDYRVWVGLAIVVGLVALVGLVLRMRLRRRIGRGTEAAGGDTLRMHMNRAKRPHTPEPLPDPPWYTGPPSFPSQRSTEPVTPAPIASNEVSAHPAAIPPLIFGHANAKEATRPMRSIEVDESADHSSSDYGSYQYENLFPPAQPGDEESTPSELE